MKNQIKPQNWFSLASTRMLDSFVDEFKKFQRDLTKLSREDGAGSLNLMGPSAKLYPKSKSLGRNRLGINYPKAKQKLFLDKRKHS